MELERRLLLAPKLIFFFISTLNYVLGTFRVPFMEEYLKIKAKDSGILTALVFFPSLFGVVAWGNLADYTKKHKLILICLCLGYGGVFSLLNLKWFLPESWHYFLACIVFFLFGGVICGIMPLTDGQILKLLNLKYGLGKEYYGRQLMFGTIAYGLSSALWGKLFKILGSKLSLVYIVPIVSLLTAAVVAIFAYPDSGRSIVHGKNERGTEEVAERPKKLPSTREYSVADIFQALFTFRFLKFLTFVFLVGIGRSVVSIYMASYLKDSCKFEDDIIGYAYLFHAAMSIVFLFSGTLILKRLSFNPMLCIGLLGLTIRVAAYASMKPGTHFSLVFATETMNAVSFCFTHMAGVREASACAPAGLETTFQGIYTAMYTTLPSIIVSIVGGRIFDWDDGKTLFVWSAYLALGSFLVVFFYTCLAYFFPIINPGHNYDPKISSSLSHASGKAHTYTHK